MGEPKLSIAEKLKRGSDRICSLILFSDMEWVDIQIEANGLRELCLLESPDKIELFDAIFMGRFERLWEQWRNNPALDPDTIDWDWEWENL